MSAARAKVRHGSILEAVPVASIRPANQNDLLYRPIDLADPDIQALADSIRKYGLREPLVLTLDNVILSGHRRHAACKLAGLSTVLCRRESILSTDPGFLPLLCEFNRQRVKSPDEVLREEIVSTDPEEAHRVILEYRKQKAAFQTAGIIEIEGFKHRARLTKAKQPFLEAVLEVLRYRRDFWPLTLRQIHYALLNHPPLKNSSKPDSVYVNDLESYKNLSNLLARARIFGAVPWQAVDDETRPFITCRSHKHIGSFVRREADDFLKGYYRDLQQSQPNHIEIIGEKNTILNIIQSVALDYCIPLTIGRGYCSLPPRYEMARRFERSGKEKLILLTLCDHDPEGEDIGHSFARSMRDDFGIKNIVPVKVALTHEQVEAMQLPPKLTAKEGSSRRKKFVERHGEHVHELEAVEPVPLQLILREAIDSVLDIDAFNAEVEAEKQDAAYLDGVRKTVHDVLGRMNLASEGHSQ